MSKKKKIVITTSEASANTASDLQPTTSKLSTEKQSTISPDGLLFGYKNYMWALAGVGLMALGFALMAGGHMPSPDVWDPDLIYSFRRTVLAPICILSGLGLQVVAIFAKK